MGMSENPREDPRLVHFWRNLATNVCIEGMWGFAIACTSLMTVVAVLLRELKAPDIAIGALPAVSTAGMALTLIPGAMFWRRLRRRKWAFVVTLLPIGATYIVLGALVHGTGLAQPRLAIGLVLLFVGVSAFANGFTYPVWSDFLNRMFPPARRGRSMGAMGTSLALMMLLGGLYAAAVLRERPGPDGFGMLFVVAGVLMILGSIGYAPVVEAELEPSGPMDLRSAARLLTSRGSPWARLTAARWAGEISRAPLIFAGILTISRFHLPPATAGVLSFLMAAGSALTQPIGGWLGDRRGHKAVMLIAYFAVPVATLLVLLGNTVWLAYAGFVLLGTLDLGYLAVMNLVIETAPEDDKSVYAAVAELSMTPPRLVAPLAAGAVAQLASPSVALAAGVVLQVAAAIVAARLVVEPRRHLPHVMRPPFEHE
jgi:MFS family permease